MNIPTTITHDGYIGLSDFRGDLIRQFEAEGFIYHSEVCIWKDPVTAMQRTKAIGLLHKQLVKDSCMSRQGVPDYLVTMRKPGENQNPIRHTPEDFPVDAWQKIASPVWMDIDVWEVALTAMLLLFLLASASPTSDSSSLFSDVLGSTATNAAESSD